MLNHTPAIALDDLPARAGAPHAAPEGKRPGRANAFCQTVKHLKLQNELEATAT